MKKLALIFCAIAALTLPARAELGREDSDATGTLNPVDFSYRFYLDAMNHFPDRIGIICGNAYELDKAGERKDSAMFFEECAKRGNAPSMIYLSALYEGGAGAAPNMERSVYWLKKAAESGWSSAQYIYGKALIEGHGMPADVKAGEDWLRKAAAQGDKDAIGFLKAKFGS